MVSYARECARAILTSTYLALAHPRRTTDATAFENAKLLFSIIESRIGVDFHITNFLALHVDYFPDEVRPEMYEMGFILSFGKYNLGKAQVTMLGNDKMRLTSDRTVDMVITVDGTAEEIKFLMKLLQGKAPWELSEEEIVQW